MKKSIFLSSVVAVAVVGMLSFSGCGGHNGSSNSDNEKVNVKDSKKVSINKDGAKITISQKDKDEKATNKVEISTRGVGVSGNKGCADATKSFNECPAEKKKGCDILKNDNDKNNDCGVTVQRKCASGEKLNYTKTEVGQEGSTILAKATAANFLSKLPDGQVYRYNGLLKVFTDDDISEGKLYLKSDLDCSVGDAKKKGDNSGTIYYNSKVYVNGYTVHAGAKTYAVVVDKDGNVVTYKEVEVKYHDKDGKKGAYADFQDENGIDLDELKNGEFKVYFFTQMNLVADDHDMKDKNVGDTTGSTGSTGVTGSGN